MNNVAAQLTCAQFNLITEYTLDRLRAMHLLRNINNTNDESLSMTYFPSIDNPLGYKTSHLTACFPVTLFDKLSKE